MKKVIFVILSIFLFLFIFNSVYSQELELSILEDRAMTGYYETEDVLYPPESELLKQGMTLSTYKQSLIDSAPKNRSSSVDNIWGTSPLTGTIRIPVLLVQFTDKSPTYTQSQMNGYFNSPTITADSISVSKYYNKQSYGDLNIIFDIYNWTTMPQSFAYYASTSNNEFQLIIDAVNTFNPSVNFAQYDNDNDGRLDGMVIIYPDIGRMGYSGIWPQARILRNYNFNPVDGKYLGNAALVPEKGRGFSNTFEISITTHEFAHVLGLPDLYSLDPSGSTNNGPITGMTMMSYQDDACYYKPINLDVWSRYFFGWINPEILTMESDKYINLRSVNDYPDAVIMKNSNMGPREYFILENRHRDHNNPNNLDSCMFINTSQTLGGIAIYHVDENKIEAHYPNNWVNWDPDGNYYNDTTWPGITFEKNYVDSVTSFTTQAADLYYYQSLAPGFWEHFDENMYLYPPYAVSDMTTRTYTGNLNPLIRFEALSGPNQYTMTAKMLVGEETITPTSSPNPGTYSQTTQVTLSTTTPQSTIHYTTDGTEPTTSSQVYSTPITIPENTTLTIKAIAKRNGYYVSDVMTSTYTITGTVATPTASQPSGVIDYLSSVTLTTSTTGANIRYTFNGSEPTENSFLYSSPITITGNTTLKARAFKTGYSPSQTVTYNYQVLSVEPVVSTLDSGYYFYGTTMALYTPTVNADIRYTTNGTDPTETSTLYTGPIAITSNFTLKARAFKQGFAPSNISTYNYGTGAAPENLIIDFELQGIDSETVIDNDQNTVQITIPYGATRNGLIPIIQVEEGCSVYPESGIPQNFNNPVNYTVSSITGQRTYTVTVINAPRVLAPVASVSGGTFDEPITLELTTLTPGAVIKYTTNGSFPTLTSNTYDSPITISSTTTLKAKAYLYTGPGFISNNSSKQNTGRNIPNLIPTTVVWHSSSILTEEYIFTRNKNKLEKKEKETVIKEEIKSKNKKETNIKSKDI